MACYFCQNNIKEIDFKNTETLKKFLSASGKIKGRNKTGLCAKHQKAMAKAVKNARIMGLLPFTTK